MPCTSPSNSLYRATPANGRPLGCSYTCRTARLSRVIFPLCRLSTSLLRTAETPKHSEQACSRSIAVVPGVVLVSQQLIPLLLLVRRRGRLSLEG